MTQTGKEFHRDMDYLEWLASQAPIAGQDFGVYGLPFKHYDRIWQEVGGALYWRAYERLRRQYPGIGMVKVAPFGHWQLLVHVSGLNRMVGKTGERIDMGGGRNKITYYLRVG